ncbi:aminotransferase class I/II-fold pyridoxal phosphate-dependent enzyme [Fulvivirgaceae bacterium PWU4]|uniref:Aminotransferase class I/II-fold pyridoxal phosphate-dependent enzyme n=1 Tax=Chryseosolibacter histidini TaxID=2782349 RepID=A0AAP2DNJ2_9BACT|nr:methionine aminotransferase [Chryseosolibacter histidini]MBT1699603.1 aminotransferase class I/II-fold pyridoxal phosphate-dependent enzyme [Chryseosolibacter histidini]
MIVQSRLPDIGTSIFAVMSKMALEHGAINLSQGFPDFALDDTIIHLVHRYMMEGNNQYAPMPGVPALRHIIAEVIMHTYGHKADPETGITVTAGATEGIFSCISAFINPGDEVILFDPAYDSYDPAIRLNGGIPVQINLRFPGFSIDWDEVKKKITPRTRMIMVNTPHNPSGAVLQEEDLQELERLALKHNLIVLSDEVYDRLIYDGIPHRSVLTRPGLAAQSVAIFSFGKTFHATGWKTGYVVAPENLTREIRKTHQFIVFAVNTPVQMALAEYMKNPDHYRNLGNFYQRKRDFFLEQIRGSSFEPLPCHGSYFQVVSYRNIASTGDVGMAETLTKKFKVAAIPVSVFYQDKTDNRLLRFCFAKKEETLAKAGEILKKI